MRYSAARPKPFERTAMDPAKAAPQLGSNPTGPRALKGRRARSGGPASGLLPVVTSLLVVLMAIPACVTVTPDSVMELTRQAGTPGEVEAGEQLVAWATSRELDVQTRMYALRALLRMEQLPDHSVASLGQLVASGAFGDSWTAYAAYVLGELREKSSIPYLLAALSRPLGSKSAYQVMEAIARNIRFVLDDPEMNTRALAALHHFSASQSHMNTTIYELLNEYLTNLTSLVISLDRLQRAGSQGGRPAESAALYEQTRQALLHVYNNRAKYAASMPDHVRQLERLFATALSENCTQNQSLWLLTAWYASALVESPSFAALVATSIERWAEANPTGSLKLLLYWGMVRGLKHSTALQSAFLELMQRSDVDRVLVELVGRMLLNGKTNLDPIQRALGIVPDRNEAAPPHSDKEPVESTEGNQ